MSKMVLDITAKYLPSFENLSFCIANQRKLFVFTGLLLCVSFYFHTSNGGEAGDGVTARNLNTNHVVAAGVQGSEAVVVQGGTVHKDWAVGPQFSVEQGHCVEVQVIQITLHPRHQEGGGTPGLQFNRKMKSVSLEEEKITFNHLKVHVDRYNSP